MSSRASDGDGAGRQNVTGKRNADVSKNYAFDAYQCVCAVIAIRAECVSDGVITGNLGDSVGRAVAAISFFLHSIVTVRKPISVLFFQFVTFFGRINNYINTTIIRCNDTFL